MNPPHGYTSQGKRIVFISSNSSKWYEQAIFVIKKDIEQDRLPTDLLNEAENIIENYMKSNNKIAASVTNKKWRASIKHWAASLSMVVASIIIWAIISRKLT